MRAREILIESMTFSPATLKTREDGRTIISFVDDYDEEYDMNVANSNGYEIQRMLELEPDEYGYVANEDLPAIMQKLMKLKNGDTSSHTRDSETSQGEMRKRTSADNVTTIGRGPTMMDMGRSQSQINSYVDRLMKLVQYAQKNNYGISWG